MFAARHAHFAPWLDSSRRALKREGGATSFLGKAEPEESITVVPI